MGKNNLKNHKINFVLEDIKYLILKKDEEIINFIKELDCIFENENLEKLTILKTKIINIKNINEDF